MHRSLLALAFAFLPAALQAQSPFDSLHFRSIGPAATGGRIHDIEVDPKDPSTIYVASASGGIWKTTNKGTFWTPIFEGVPDNTFGDLAICDADSRVIWAGTGEQNNRQSSSWGGGRVSLDRRRRARWTHVGLTSTASIGRVRAHPADCNIAYVAAVGNLWKANTDRGVFKTTDGGRTLDQGALRRHPHGRDRPRDGSARSERALRRDVPAPAQRVRLQRRRTRQRDLQDDRRRRHVEEARERHSRRRQGTHRARDLCSRIQMCSSRTIEHATEGGTYRTDDAGATWRRTSRVNPRPMYYSAPFIDPTNDKRIWLLGTTIVKSEDGGVTFEGQPTSPTYDIGLKTDHHTMWIDPRDSRHVLVGGDGGLNESLGSRDDVRPH